MAHSDELKSIAQRAVDRRMAQIYADPKAWAALKRERRNPDFRRILATGLGEASKTQRRKRGRSPGKRPPCLGRRVPEVAALTKVTIPESGRWAIRAGSVVESTAKSATYLTF